VSEADDLWIDALRSVRLERRASGLSLRGWQQEAALRAINAAIEANTPAKVATEAIRLAYKTGHNEGYEDGTDDGTGNGGVDHQAAEEGWQQYLERNPHFQSDEHP
jgi:flagellar biosynthesis/type III secretory pathway protein FliH